MTATFLVLLAALALGILAYLQVTHLRSVRAERGALFNQVSHLFDDVSIRQDGMNYPILTGRLQGFSVRLEPVVDTLGFRKLPVLWLLITYYRPLPVRAPLDILLRPHGNEFFSPNQRYEGEMTPGSGYPDHVRVVSQDPDAAPDLGLLAPFRAFLCEPDTKELLVTSNGVRVVRRLAEAEQAHYRVTRSVEMRPELTEAALVPVLTTLTAVGEALVAPAAGQSRWGSQ